MKRFVPGWRSARRGLGAVASVLGLSGVLLGPSACDGNRSGEVDEGGSADAAGGGVETSGGSALPAGVSEMEWTVGIGHDHWNTRANLAETAIAADTVGDLSKKWDVGNGLVSGTPAVADGVVYFGDGAGKARAVDAKTGAVKWEVDTIPVTSSPAVVDDRVFFAGAADVVALDTIDGSVVWQADVSVYEGTILFGSPHPVGDLVIQGTSSMPASPDLTFRGNIVAIDQSDGAIRWRFDVTKARGGIPGGKEYAVGVSVWSSAAVDTRRQRLFIGTGQSYDLPASPMSDSVIAVDYETGDYAWHRQFTANDVWVFEVDRIPTEANALDFDVGAAPNLFMAGDVEAVGVGDKAGVYYAMDRETGEELWARNVATCGDHACGPPQGGVMTVAAYHDGTIYAATNEWVASPEEADFTDPANKTHVVALDAATGDEQWSETVAGATVGGVTYANGLLFHSSGVGVIRAFDVATGAERWSDSTAGSRGIVGGMSVYDGMVYTGSGAGYFGGTPGALIAYGL